MELVSFLISTLGCMPQHLHELLNDIVKQTYRNVEAVVVLQSCDESIRQRVTHVIDSITEIPIQLVVSKTLGLSKSRNVAIASSRGDLLIVCDDDCRYPSGAASHIVEAMAERTDWDIISFQMAEPGTQRLHKQYPFYKKKHNLRSLMHVSSVEIAMRKQVVKNTKLFDERLGLGTPYITGEENVMLVDLHRKNVTIGYYPKIIVFHPLEKSGCGACDIDQLILSKGVLFRRMFGPMAVVLGPIFFIRRLFPGKSLRFAPKQWKYLFKGLALRL